MRRYARAALKRIQTRMASSGSVSYILEGRQTASEPWPVKDACWLIASVMVLVALPIYSVRGRLFWEDEMLGYLLLRDPSFRHMVAAWVHGADGGGFSFYLTGRLWFHLFGASVGAFRMYSATCFAAAYAINWVTMRRFYSAPIVTWASLSIWLVSPVLFQHMGEGRFYGLFMAAVALTIFLCVRADEQQTLRPLFYGAVFLAHALLVTSHVLGVAYSFFVVTSMVLLDYVNRRARPALYSSAAASWLLLIPSLPAIRASARVGKPFFWTMQPGWVGFVSNYTGFTLKLTVPIFLLLVTIFTTLALKGTLRSTLQEAYRRHRPLYLVGLLLFMVPIAFYVEGMFGPALCISRYLQPVALASVYMVAELLFLAVSILPASIRSNRAITAGGAAVFVLLVGTYDLVYRPRHTGLELDYTTALTRNLPPAVPIVCEDAFAFSELISQQHSSPVLYTYLLDWQNTLSPQTPRLEVTQYHLMENWKDVGYYAGSIEYEGAFLSQHQVFYSLTMKDVGDNGPAGTGDRSILIGSKLHQRLAHDTRYNVSLFKVVPLGELQGWVWRICRIDSEGCSAKPVV